ncbi:pyridoxamine 5'-phosphate oxidase [Actinorhabdospora filicis]|uniref:Pyridoxamine 5'-phosphate oxidase n=1 Tax=Actinorhabdospora filicis TaxID=1785913 RepID=A0A9W6W918_9ACTN|nr:pyridoxamine 5'-phosphate oxidase family protein [Actinorhabdospora filicis]GLZ76220.1 pyridoxamine 5'-phosphate oxidase [Actinorhabdospora filicis]
MSRRFAQLAFTPGVRRHQAAHGSERAYRGMAEGPSTADALGDDERLFIGRRDSFYLGTVGETGWPYIQHRGGPEGFLKVLDDHTLAFADFRGNRQYISRGNLDHDDRVSLFLMDYAEQVRLKLLGRARVVEDDPELFARLHTPDYRAKVERAIVITVEGFDWNCPQHIPVLYPAEVVERVIGRIQEQAEEEKAALLARIAELERVLRFADGRAQPEHPASPRA